ncbi:MAG: DUF3516 domain-containing protein, partial [Actinomycetes bacterium]|nr:DUF3516 domain-containing protein [Actinomycetes bacterium]MDX5450393.1 DUF3516 domain-containing protein [Actinomycetes bacterium]
PLAELLEPAFAMYRRTNPWILDAELSPKSVVRDMLEKAMTFGELISTYGLERTEGVALRYLAEAYRAMRQTVPEEHRTEEVAEITEWLGELVRSTDSSLLDEWERLANPEALTLDDADPAATDTSGTVRGPARPLSGNPRVLRRLVRNAMFRRVELASRRDYQGLSRLDGDSGWDPETWENALAPLFALHGDDAVGIGPNARSSALLTFVDADADATDGRVRAALAAAGHAEPQPGLWIVRQVIDDPAGDHDWAFVAAVDLDESDEAGEPALELLAFGDG